MFQRVFAVVVCLVTPSIAFAQPSLPLPAQVVGSPGQPVEAVTDALTLGASGAYTWAFTRSSEMLWNFQIGGYLGDLPPIQIGKPFTYVSGTTRRFRVYGILPPKNHCSEEVVTITFRDIIGAPVLQRQVTFKCFNANAVLSFRNALKGSGTPTDPARFCGAAAPVRIDGGGSSTASTYEIEVRDSKTAALAKRTLTTAEAASIGNFDLQKIVPQHFFKGGSSYSVTLTTLPARSSVTRTIAFDAATPQFRMTHNNGKVFVSGDDSEPVVICPGKMLLNAADTRCESSYFITVEESFANWTRTHAYAWSRWFTGQAPDVIDLDAIIAAHPDALDPPNKPFVMEPQQGNVLKAVPRYYRVGFATGEPAWDIRWLFVRTATPDECQRPIGKDIFTQNLCPRTDNVQWPNELGAELKRLFFAPCSRSTPLCPVQSESEVRPYSTGTKKNYFLAWEGKLYSSTSHVDLTTQDQIVAAMKQKAAEQAPICSTTQQKKVPVEIEPMFDFANGKHRVFINVRYACCDKLF